MTIARTDIRQCPDESFIEDIRKRYPTEKEIDRILTRKMYRRSGPAYEPVSLEQMIDGTEKLIASQYAGDFQVRNPRWLTGGASKIQMIFEFDAPGFSEDGKPVPMVLRMEPSESVVETSRLREFEAIQAVRDFIPAPPCYWIDGEGDFLPYPALIYGFADGVVKPSKVTSKQVSGIGINFGPDLRTRLAPEFIGQMAAFHTLDASKLDQLTSFDKPVIGSTEAVMKHINWWRRVWEEDRGEDVPLMDIAYNWLIKNAPPIETLSLVHGDCRSGNFLFNEETAKITAWLDWELSLLGDRHQDIAWATSAPYRHKSEDGKKTLVCGMLPMEEFVAMYEDFSGLKVDEDRLKYYQILNNFMSASICLGTGYRVAKGAKTHQDVVVTSLSMISYFVLEQLRRDLSEVTA